MVHEMKLIILTICFVGIWAETETELWQKFKIDHKRSYSSSQEEAERLEIFKETLQKVENHNAKYKRGESTYYLGINKFADMTTDELSEKYLSKIVPPSEKNEAKISLSDDIPEYKNWTDEGVVTNIKDQGACGCCYAFASIAAIESGNAIVNKELINLSVQQLLDCSNGDIYLNHGCNGGIIEGSIHYVMDHGIEREESYPYEDTLKDCRANETLNVVSVKEYKNVPEDENLLKAAVGTIGPVASAVYASEWFYYQGGIIDGGCYDKSTNHVILIAGYGTEDDVDYWYVKNSWGPNFGLNGYLKVRRNHNNAFCISTYTAYPIMK